MLSMRSTGIRVFKFAYWLPEHVRAHVWGYDVKHTIFKMAAMCVIVSFQRNVKVYWTKTQLKRIEFLKNGLRLFESFQDQRFWQMDIVQRQEAWRVASNVLAQYVWFKPFCDKRIWLVETEWIKLVSSTSSTLYTSFRTGKLGELLVTQWTLDRC